MDNTGTKQISGVSEIAMTNEMLCTILSEVQALRYAFQEQGQIINNLCNQIQGMSNDILQLRMQQRQGMPQMPILQPPAMPQPKQNSITNHATPNQAPSEPLWDKRDEDHPEAIFSPPKPSFRIPNR